MVVREEEFWKQRVQQERNGAQYPFYYTQHAPHRYAAQSLQNVQNQQTKLANSPMATTPSNMMLPGHLSYVSPRAGFNINNAYRVPSVSTRVGQGSNVYAPGHTYPSYSNVETTSQVAPNRAFATTDTAHNRAFALTGPWGAQLSRAPTSLHNPRQRSWQQSQRRPTNQHQMGRSADNVDRVYRYRNNSRIECNYTPLRNSFTTVM